MGLRLYVLFLNRTVSIIRKVGRVSLAFLLDFMVGGMGDEKTKKMSTE